MPQSFKLILDNTPESAVRNTVGLPTLDIYDLNVLNGTTWNATYASSMTASTIYHHFRTPDTTTLHCLNINVSVQYATITGQVIASLYKSPATHTISVAGTGTVVAPINRNFSDTAHTTTLQLFKGVTYDSSLTAGNLVNSYVTSVYSNNFSIGKYILAKNENYTLKMQSTSSATTAHINASWYTILGEFMPEEKDFAELMQLNGVEIFQTGKWNGDNYTQDDLQEMVNAFTPLKNTLQPYVKLGHNDKQPLLAKDGLPAAGWIENIYIQGNKLMADIKDMPKTIYELVKNRAYKRISSEIYWNLKDASGKSFKRALKAIALLGGDTPAVGSLADVQALYTKRSISDLEGNFKTAEIEYFTREEIEMEEQLKAQIAELTSKLEAKEKELADAKVESEKKFSDIEKAKADLEAKVAEFELASIRKDIESKVNDLITRKKLLPAQKDFAMEALSKLVDVKSYSAESLNDNPIVKMYKANAEVVSTKELTADEKAKDEELKAKELSKKVSEAKDYAEAKKAYAEGVK